MIPRYTHPEMARVWSEEHKLDTWLRVELAVCEAWAELGAIPQPELAAIRRATVDPARVQQLLQETHHDIISFVRAVAESVGPPGRFIHLGLTSSDVLDTALALQVLEAAAILDQDLQALEAATTELARRHKLTPMIGRTHGIHAEPTTFGHKMALWVWQIRQDRERLAQARDELAIGKLSGAVGTHANVPAEVEERVCARLGLAPAAVSSQIIQRDRHAYFIATLAVIAATLEQMATELRGLQRTEVSEVAEPFSAGQQGSSAMPHKRNPELAERICGLARLVRGYALPALDDV
ncbi:MAG: adenylosuccinate lyase, partial [Chloroflexi bacterium]|nr:adenylosuccinate lyase [Chloroflexota bacterium]